MVTETVPLWLMCVAAFGSKPIWLPASSPVGESALPSVPAGLVADLVTAVVAASGAPSEIYAPLADPRIAQHPVRGPFLAAADRHLVIAAVDRRDALHAAQLMMGTGWADVRYAPLAVEGWPGVVSVGTIEPLYAPASAAQGTSSARISLSPQNLAVAIGAFDEWTGAHLDLAQGRLVVFGRDIDRPVPALSSADLITAYRAVFAFEAAGDSLFVDMDPGADYHQYLVTFGGGFQDTHLGEVLLSGDLLLKALSTGVDPWSNERPLVEQMCSSSTKTPLQQSICGDLIPYLDKDVDHAQEIEDELAKYVVRQADALLISTMATVSDRDAPACWNAVFGASPSESARIRLEVERDGNFSIGDSVCYVQSGRGAAYDKEALRQRVEQILHLTPEERQIVARARRLSDSEQRYQYANLAFISPRVRAHLGAMDGAALTRLFASLNRLAAIDGQDAEGGESFAAELALLKLMSDNPAFASRFAEMSDRDQLTMGFMSSSLILNPEWGSLVRGLQYYQPLCQTWSAATTVDSGETAFLAFVCEHLAKFPRTYLADMVRAELGDKYQTAHDIALAEGSRETGEVRYWFDASDRTPVVRPSSDLATMWFDDPRLVARAERVGSRTGGLVGEGSPAPAAVAANLDLVNENYDELAQLFPTLAELRELVKVLNFFRWLRYYHAEDVDLTAFDAAVDLGSPTERVYPVRALAMSTADNRVITSIGGIDGSKSVVVQVDDARADELRRLVQETAPGTFVTVEADRVAWRAVAPASPPTVGSRFTQGVREAVVGQQGEDALVVRDEHGFQRYTWSTGSDLGVASLTTWSGTDGTRTTEGRARAPAWRLEWREHRAVAVALPVSDAAPAASATDLLRCGVARGAFPPAAIREARERWQLSTGLIVVNPDGSGARTVSAVGGCTTTPLAPVEVSAALAKAERAASVRLGGDPLVAVRVVRADGDGVMLDVRRNGAAQQISAARWFGVVGGVASRSPATAEALRVEPARRALWIVPDAAPEQSWSAQFADRDFLVASLASLRKWLLAANPGAGLPVLVGNGVLGRDAHVRPTGPIKPTRSFVLDPAGLPVATQVALGEVEHSVGAELASFDPSAASPASPTDEVVWVTALPEEEATLRLAMALGSGWLRAGQRVRIFNLGNAYSGSELSALVQGEAGIGQVGAWPHYVRVDTAGAVLARMLRTGATHGIDQDVALAVRGAAAFLKGNPTPERLRTLRDLPQLNATWEETGVSSSSAWQELALAGG